MTPSLRILATTSFSIGLLVFGCGGKVLEHDTSTTGSTDSGAGGASAGGGAHKGGSSGDYFGTGGVGGGVSAGGSWQAGGSGGGSGNSNGEGACNPSDLELMETSYDYLVLYPAMGDKCWKTCFGDMATVYECVYACVQKLTGGKLSPACTACHAADSECVAQTCHDSCMTAPLYSECNDCRCWMNGTKQKCATEFLACSGKPNCGGY